MAAKTTNPVYYIYLMLSMKIYIKYLLSVTTALEQVGQGLRHAFDDFKIRNDLDVGSDKYRNSTYIRVGSFSQVRGN